MDSGQSVTLVLGESKSSIGNMSSDNSEIYSLSLASGEIQALTERNGPDDSPAISPDGKRIAYVGYDDKVQTYQVARLYVMNRDGSDKQVITSKLDRSVSSPVWDNKGEGIYVQYDDEGNSKVAFVTLDGEWMDTREEHRRDVSGSTVWWRELLHGGQWMLCLHRDPAGVSRRMLPLVVVTGRLPGASPRSTRISSDIESSAKSKKLWYESSYDQRRIHGWVVTPPDFDPSKKYPLILEIHGGPISNYGDRFSAEMQLYASAGYVVLYANPRGSTSYGEEFGNLLYHDYPGQDYDDLMSGVDAVIAKGFIDEDNLFVTGGSAGGIMTAWIVGKTDRFRAAAVGKPVINWYSKVLVADNYYGYHNYRYPGSPWENPEAYMKYSPISLVGNVSTPSMVIVGTADLRTPLSESKQFYHALKLRKVDTALVKIPGASHNISRRPSQLITKVAHVLAWFEKYRK